MFILTVSARPTLQLEVSFSTLSEWEQFLNSIPFRWVPLMTVSRQLGGRLSDDCVTAARRPSLESLDSVTPDREYKAWGLALSYHSVL